MSRRAESTGSRSDHRQFRRSLHRWFRLRGRDLPWRRTHDPYAILVSEFMLQQTQVATVISYYQRWLDRFPDFAALARAKESDVLHAWQGLGYYARARHLHAAGKFVRENFGGELPADVARIAQLPGVGRYTAGAIASFAFDLPEPIVDANIARVLARLTNWEIPIDTSVGRAHLWQTATALLPTTGVREHNSALMDLGAMICLPRQPRCAECPVRSFCRAERPAISAGQEKATGYRSPVGTARPHAAAQPRAPGAIARALARHVDSAPPARGADGAGHSSSSIFLSPIIASHWQFSPNRGQSCLRTISSGSRSARSTACRFPRRIVARSHNCFRRVTAHCDSLR